MSHRYFANGRNPVSQSRALEQDIGQHAVRVRSTCENLSSAMLCRSDGLTVNIALRSYAVTEYGKFVHKNGH